MNKMATEAVEQQVSSLEKLITSAYLINIIIEHFHKRSHSHPDTSVPFAGQLVVDHSNHRAECDQHLSDLQ